MAATRHVTQGLREIKQPCLMRLKSGQKSPQFSEKDVFGRIIDLTHYHDKKIIIAFFRHAGCPFCNLRVHALTKIFEELKSRGTEMIFFFESKEAVILRSSFHQGISPIPLISDPGKTWYATYGLETSLLKSSVSHLTSFIPTVIKANKQKVPIHIPSSGESFSTMPAEFLVDKNNVIQKAHYSSTLDDRIDIDEIIRFSKQ